MSWQIPTEIEKDFKSGKASYRTFQTGNGGQSILPVPSNSYVVIFGYDFSPAGGGLIQAQKVATGTPQTRTNVALRYFETQQISFYTGTDFYPFIHHVNVNTVIAPSVTDASAPDAETVTEYNYLQEVDSHPIARQLYITSSNDVTITHGLILNSTRASANNIPITNRTPQGLTYGGSPQSISTQTNYGPAGTPQQFMQPSVKDYADFAFGLLPANPDGQAFATPDTANGLRDASEWLTTAWGFQNDAGANYFLCLHYALYTETVPESRG
jgi:hypothetical protein